METYGLELVDSVPPLRIGRARFLEPWVQLAFLVCDSEARVRDVLSALGPAALGRARSLSVSHCSVKPLLGGLRGNDLVLQLCGGRVQLLVGHAVVCREGHVEVDVDGGDAGQARMRRRGGGGGGGGGRARPRRGREERRGDEVGSVAVTKWLDGRDAVVVVVDKQR